MASLHVCISSINNSVSPGIIGIPVVPLRFSQVLFTSIFSGNCFLKSGCFSKLISKKYLNVLPNSLTAVDLPTCRAPRISNGLRCVEVFHSRNLSSICLLKYAIFSIFWGKDTTFSRNPYQKSRKYAQNWHRNPKSASKIKEICPKSASKPKSALESNLALNRKRPCLTTEPQPIITNNHCNLTS